MRILEDLYYCNIRPCEQDVKKNGEIKELFHQYVIAEDNFSSLLNEMQKTRFQELMELKNQLNGEFEREKFIYGFQLGVQIFSEALGERRKEI